MAAGPLGQQIGRQGLAKVLHHLAALALRADLQERFAELPRRSPNGGRAD